MGSISISFLSAAASATGSVASAASGTASGAATQSSPYSQFFTIGILVLMFVVMYFVLIRPQRKRQKEEEKMRTELEIGDEIVTIGGINGKIVTIKEDSLVIETSADRNKLRIKKWAIQTNVTKAAIKAEKGTKPAKKEKESE